MNDAADDGGARALKHVMLIGKGNNGAVRRMNGRLQKLARTAQRGARLVLKPLGHGVDRYFSRDFATGVTTHAIGNHQ